MAAAQLQLTALGAKATLFLGLIVIAFYASPYTNLFFLMLSFLAVVGILGAWWTRSNLHGVTCNVTAVEPAPANAGHDFRFQLDPAGRTRFDVSLLLKISGRWHTADTSGVVTENTSRSGRLPGQPRGVHSIEAAALESRFPFGVFRTRVPVEPPTEVIAYPIPLELSQGPESLISELSGSQQLSLADLAPTGLREYRPGDPLRLIHWKASARRLDLVVKEMDGDGQNGVEVVFDRRCNEQEFELALSTLSALALLTMQNKKLLTIHSQGISSTYGIGNSPLRDCLVWLAEVQQLEKGAAPPPPASPSVLRLPCRAQEVSSA
jgi:uncharacterized protein (DUF58 family)